MASLLVNFHLIHVFHVKRVKIVTKRCRRVILLLKL